MDRELIEISEEIFRNIISRLTLHLRFMDIAIDRYEFVPDTFSFECDGRFFHYNPITVIQTFKNDPNKLTRGYFHTVLHNIFQHPYLAGQYNQSCWDIACDIAVENLILEFDLDCMRLRTDPDLKRQIDRIRQKVDLLTAQKIYHYLKDELTGDERKLLRQAFQFDDHTSWYQIRQVESSSEQLFGDETHDNPSKATNNRFDKASHDSDSDSSERQKDTADEDALIEQMKNTMKDWQEISEKIELDLETFHKEYGDQYETLVQSLEKLHKEKYSYEQFLQKFMVLGEKMMINDDEFDYIFYTYGLKLYGNLPLIEPLEYKETRALKELVIAIDTSGSVQGDMVQGFLQKTYNILSQTEQFFSRYCVRIIQCDMKIQNEAIVTTAGEFEDYIEHTQIYGLGGTDFRPVFDYISDKLRNHEITELGGLIYFTDGDGVYPKRQPEYRTAFVFLEGNKDMTVPPWAIKYNIDEDTIKGGL